MSDQEQFLARWSRRKRAAAQDEDTIESPADADVRGERGRTTKTRGKSDSTASRARSSG